MRPPRDRRVAAPAGGPARSRFRRLLLLTLFLTFDLILFGSFVRVVDAGLGCPDWPGCYGKLTPAGAAPQIAEQAALRPDGPVTVFKAWVEMLHRYVAGFLGLLIIGLLAMSRREPGASVGLAALTLAWVILQGLFGMWTVTLRLQPAIVTAHLLGAIVLFGLLIRQLHRVAPGPVPSVRGGRGLGALAGTAVVLVVVQIALGGWVSSNYATLACRDFPSCQGSWWPDMAFARGFELWRPLGFGADGQVLPFAALTAVHYTHRLFAYLVLAVVVALGWRARRLPGIAPLGNGLLIASFMQVATGLTNIFLEWPAAAAILHTGGAAALFGLALMLKLRLADAEYASDPRAPVLRSDERNQPFSGA